MPVKQPYFCRWKMLNYHVFVIKHLHWWCFNPSLWRWTTVFCSLTQSSASLTSRIWSFLCLWKLLLFWLVDSHYSLLLLKSQIMWLGSDLLIMLVHDCFLFPAYPAELITFSIPKCRGRWLGLPCRTPLPSPPWSLPPSVWLGFNHSYGMLDPNWAVFETLVDWWLVRGLYYPIYWGL